MSKKIISKKKKEELVIVYQILKALKGIAITPTIGRALNRVGKKDIPYKRILKMLTRVGYLKREHHVRVGSTMYNRWEIIK